MALSRIFPQSRIVYVTHSQKGALAERVLGVESADAELGWHQLLIEGSQKPALPERASKLLDGAHTVISFNGAATDPMGQSISRKYPEARVVSLNTRHEEGGHVTESILAQLKDWPVLGEALKQMLRSVASRGVGFRRAPEQRILIHPGAGKQNSRWPAERYLELIKLLADAGLDPHIILGEVELETWPAELVEQFRQAGQVAEPRTLLGLLDELQLAAAFVGNDSGPGHLAAALGVPTVSIFGTDPTRWKPIGPQVEVIQSRLDQLQADDVYNVVSKLAGD